MLRKTEEGPTISMVEKPWVVCLTFKCKTICQHWFFFFLLFIYKICLLYDHMFLPLNKGKCDPTFVSVYDFLLSPPALCSLGSLDTMTLDLRFFWPRSEPAVTIRHSLDITNEIKRCCFLMQPEIRFSVCQEKKKNPSRLPTVNILSP